MDSMNVFLEGDGSKPEFSISPEPHPWGEFLEARLKAISWMKDERGYSDKEIKEFLSLDEHQLRLIIYCLENKKMNVVDSAFEDGADGKNRKYPT